MTSIYIHIPFCERICFYCDFPKKVGKKSEITTYLQALRQEIAMYDVPNTVDTLYLGGGTPSILNDEQFEIINDIVNKFTFSKNYEFTIECNPEHITPDKLKWFKKLGVNRISLGVQTFNDKLLRLLNRNHNKTMVIDAVNLLKKEGFTNISIDLMFAIPFQTMDMVIADVYNLLSLDVPHVSYYSLILEENTVFNRWINEGKITLLDNELEALMYEEIISTLKKHYHHYEISNFAYSNYESKHNQIYWTNEHYYGFGMGASGYLDNVRYYNEDRVNKYLQKVNNSELPIMHQDELTKDEIIKEALLLGLRLIDGVNVKELNERYQIDVVKYFQQEFSELLQQGLIEVGENIKLTHKGLFYGNEVFSYFI